MDHAEAELRALIDARGDAVRRKDIAALMASVAPDTLSFDVVDPLQYTGAAGTRKRAEEWFANFASPIGYEFRDLSITASGDVAFAHCLTRVHGTTVGGDALDMWLRSTTCFRRIDGKWLVTHEHNSVPFDTATGKASLGLQP
jgi:ketosteroid isomerase-like protein